MISHLSTFLAIAALMVTLLIPLKSIAYDTYRGYFVCYDQNTRGQVGSCQLSTTICSSQYLHYYGQYVDQKHWADGLLRCVYDPSSKVDPVAKHWKT